MITNSERVLLNELSHGVAIGHPYLTTNVGREDLKRVVELVNRLSGEADESAKKLEQIQKVNDDYLCIMSYQRKLLECNGVIDAQDAIAIQFTELLADGRVPETKDYSEYQKKAAEFLNKKKE